VARAHRWWRNRPATSAGRAESDERSTSVLGMIRSRGKGRRGWRFRGTYRQSWRGRGARVRRPVAIGGQRVLPCSPRTSCPRKGTIRQVGPGVRERGGWPAYPFGFVPEWAVGCFSDQAESFPPTLYSFSDFFSFSFLIFCFISISFA
jgi:hypothetical protein